MNPDEALALVSGKVDEALLLRNEYLAAENQILKSKIDGRIQFSDEEKMRLARLGKRIGEKALNDIGCIVTPHTIMDWYKKFIAKKFDSSKNRKKRGRPRTPNEIEGLVIQIILDNPNWGNERLSGMLKILGISRCAETIRDIRHRNGLPDPNRSPTLPSWDEFIRRHKDNLFACDFFTKDVVTSNGWVITFYVLFFIHIDSRQVHIAGITTNPDEDWMKQIARNLTMTDVGFLSNCRYLIMDRDGKFCPVFRRYLKIAGVEPIRLPPHSPNLNAFAERWVRSIKEECLSKFMLFSEEELRHAINEYVALPRRKKPSGKKQRVAVSKQARTNRRNQMQNKTRRPTEILLSRGRITALRDISSLFGRNRLILLLLGPF